MPTSPRFTPSLLDEETLEALFVRRQRLVTDALARVERAAAGTDRSARLFVGPRGAGKTHLLSLVAHRARRLAGFGTRFQFAWLPEDLWVVDSLDDLMTEILAVLEPEPPPVEGEPAAALRRTVAERGPIVVLVENFDQILTAIGGEGQRRLRALIENDRSLLLIASTTRLSPALANQSEPFYGFFDQVDLPPFTIDDAVEMLQRIATHEGRPELATALDGPHARRRLAAVAHLAGGQPRMWALLAAGLTIEGLDELVELLLTRFDDLTPYYQEQMHRLSPQERKVVRALSDAPGSLTVGQIAEAARIDGRSAARTLTGLRKAGWVRQRHGPIVARADQRLSYYDLAEPLARLTFQLKEARGKPVRTVIEFLKHWFDQDALSVTGTDSLTQSYLALAGDESRHDPWIHVFRSLSAVDGGEVDPTVSLFAPPFVPAADQIATALAHLDDALAAYQAGDPTPLLAQPASISSLMDEELVADPDAHHVRLHLARLALDVAPPEDWVDRIETQLPADDEDDGGATARVAAVHRARLGHLDAAQTLIERSMAGATIDDLLWLAGRLVQFGSPGLALPIVDAATEQAPGGWPLVTAGRIREAALRRLGRTPETMPSWHGIVATLRTRDPDDPALLAARTDLAWATLLSGQTKQAITQLQDILDALDGIREPTDSDVLTLRNDLGLALCRDGQAAQALHLLETNLADLEKVYGPDHLRTLMGRTSLARACQISGDLDRAVSLLEDALMVAEAAQGAEHPMTLACRTDLAITYIKIGQVDRAIPLFETTLGAHARTFGPDHPDTLASQHNLATAILDSGDAQRAVLLLEVTVAARKRTLGIDHPETARSRAVLERARKTIESS